MRVYLKLILVLLLAARFAPCTRQVLPTKINASAVQRPADDVLKTPQEQAAYMAEDTTNIEVALQLRWADLLPCFFAGMKMQAFAITASVNRYFPVLNHRRHAFYRSLLFPSHFFR